MEFWSIHVRKVIFAISAFISATIFILVIQFVPSTTVQIIRLTQWYSLAAVIYLYIALLASPLFVVFPSFPLRRIYTIALRALGISAWYFSLLHAGVAFFGQLGGFEGISFLSNNYIFSLSFGVVALVILSLMALTSFDYMVAKLTFPRWKLLQRCVYIAGAGIVVHALLLGTHFSDLSESIPQLFFFMLFVLLILEGVRLDLFLRKKWTTLPAFGPSTTLVLCVAFFLLVSSSLPTNNKGQNMFNIHAQHIQLAKENQQQSTSPFTALQGDKTKRFTVMFEQTSSPVIAGVDTVLRFLVYDAATGEPVHGFTKVSEKFVHLIVVNNDLTYFVHIHPEQDGNTFTITTQFPQADTYHLYVDFQPFGAIEQQFAFILPVTGVEKTSSSKANTTMRQTIGDYTVALSQTTPFQASAMSVGNQTMSFTLFHTDKSTPVTTLKPYLGAFGHLVLINKKTYEYIHVHPTIPAKTPTSNGGPIVTFLPLGLYGPIQPGTYRVFAQFNPDDTLITSDFTIEIR